MFWKTCVPVSEQMYTTASPGMQICRILGLFPFSMCKIDTQIYIKQSLIHTLYSFILGTVLVVWSYQGLLEDMWDTQHSIRTKTHTEMYVMFCDITVVQLVAIFGIFVHTVDFNNFFEFLKHLNEVDLTIPPNGLTSARRGSMFMAIAITVTTLCMLIADLLTYITETDDIAVKNTVVKRYLPFYITYMIMILYQYQFWHFGHCVLRRLKELKKLLEIFNLENKSAMESVEYKPDPIFETLSKIKLEHKNISYIIDSMNKKNRDIIKVKPKINDKEPAPSNSNIMKLASAYLHLSDAVSCLNQLLGVTHAITIIGILWHLIESPFHLLSELAGTRKDLSYVLMNGAWCFYHLARLLILVEPCNSCKNEVQKIQSYVCNLLCSTTINDQVRSELETFSLVLIQGKLEFSAAGLTTIDRSLVTALLGTITTYLVILLQFQGN